MINKTILSLYSKTLLFTRKQELKKTNQLLSPIYYTHANKIISNNRESIQRTRNRFPTA